MTLSAKERKKRRRQKRRKRQNQSAKELSVPLGKFRNLPDNARVVRNLDGIKMSEVLLEFAGPVLPDTTDPDIFRSALLFASVAWNSATVNNPEAKELMQRTMDCYPHEDAAMMESTLHFLRARKTAHFSHIHRLIMDIAVTDTGHDYNVQVLSSPIDSPESEDE